MAQLPEFQRAQYAFTAHLRDPEHKPVPEGIEDRRMAIYRELLFNNIESFLRDGFPVLHSIYREQDWLRLARRFFADHQSKSPYFLDISAEFVDFLENEYQPVESDPPFLLELAHYEWVELALMVSPEDTIPDGLSRQGDLLHDIPVLSPLAECLSYHWPVQHISTDFQPDEPLQQPQFIIISRKPGSDHVEFMEANPVTARLFELMRENKHRNGLSLLQQISDELHHPDPATVIDGGHQILLKLHHAHVIAGTTVAD